CVQQRHSTPNWLPPIDRSARAIHLSLATRKLSHLFPPALRRDLRSLIHNVREDSEWRRDNKGSTLWPLLIGERQRRRAFGLIVLRHLANIRTKPALAVPRYLQTAQRSTRLDNVLSHGGCFPGQPDLANERDWAAPRPAHRAI